MSSTNGLTPLPPSPAQEKQAPVRFPSILNRPIRECQSCIPARGWQVGSCDARAVHSFRWHSANICAGEDARLCLFFCSCTVENRFTGRQEGRKMGIGPSRIKSFHCKSLDPWFSDLPVSSVTDSTEGKFTAETACLPASRAQSLMSVDAGLIEVQWHVCVCVGGILM